VDLAAFDELVDITGFALDAAPQGDFSRRWSCYYAPDSGLKN
jgi:hypothetical protein